jgi:hypothetical protein
MFSGNSRFVSAMDGHLMLNTLGGLGTWRRMHEMHNIMRGIFNKKSGDLANR